MYEDIMLQYNDFTISTLVYYIIIYDGNIRIDFRKWLQYPVRGERLKPFVTSVRFRDVDLRNAVPKDSEAHEQESDRKVLVSHEFLAVERSS